MSSVHIVFNAVLAVTVLSGAYYGGMIFSYAYQLPKIVEYVASSGTAEASQPRKKGVGRQESRDILFLTANLIYENMGYPDSAGAQEEAFRVNATSIINKKRFEKKENFERVISEKNPNCQYSWYCEKGKPIDMSHLKKINPNGFEIAYKISYEMVMGGFVPVSYSPSEPFDGAYYATTASYRSRDSWHRKQVELGKMCKRRTIDDHVYIAPKIKGTCRKNQYAFYDQ